MAFMFPTIRRLAGLAPRTALIMLLCMTAVGLLAACGGDPDPTATTPPHRNDTTHCHAGADGRSRAYTHSSAPNPYP